MPDFGIVGLLILLVTFFASYQGFKNPDYYERYLFRVSDIRYGRQYYRLFTSGFLHTGWWHLLLNALTFYYFSSSVEYVVGFSNFHLRGQPGGRQFVLTVSAPPRIRLFGRGSLGGH